MLQSFFFTYYRSTTNPIDLPTVWEFTQLPLCSKASPEFPSQLTIHFLPTSKDRLIHSKWSQHWCQPLSLYFSNPQLPSVQFSQESCSPRFLPATFSCLSSCSSHSCSLQQSGRCPHPPFVLHIHKLSSVSQTHMWKMDGLTSHQTGIFVWISYTSQMPAGQLMFPTGRTELLIAPL